MLPVVVINFVEILDPVSKFTEPFRFKISFSAAQHLEEDLEWSMIYIGSAEDDDGGDMYEEVLEEVVVGPVGPGKHTFILEGPCPKLDKVPSGNIFLGGIAINCFYKEKQLFKVAYFLQNEEEAETPVSLVQAENTIGLSSEEEEEESIIDLTSDTEDEESLSAKEEEESLSAKKEEQGTLPPKRARLLSPGDIMRRIVDTPVITTF